MDTQSSDPWKRSRRWSAIAQAADMADESLRAAMIAAPRFCTVVISSPLSQASSSGLVSTSLSGLPSTVARVLSGYWVDEWLPQMTALRTELAGAPQRRASWAWRRLWSRRVRAMMFSLGIVGAALAARMAAFVLAGLPTTSTLQLGLPTLARALPWEAKMAQFLARRSARSMPSLRGKAPRSTATSAPARASSGSLVTMVLPSRGVRRSSSSRTTPFIASRAGGISRRCRFTLTSSPKTVPSRRRGRSE
mmetsp:Transcript_9169/g.31045  ORF Transcript_9169/g.31045 Transcript_9169/m.31045 type:complete len:250 (+) Transcript_9169:880-1629(+)